MKFKNQKVVEIFLDGETHHDYNTSIIESHTGNLYISEDGKRLMNYGTCLAQFEAPRLVRFNETKYSSTTSKIQGMIKRELNYHTLFTIIGCDKVPMNTVRLV